MASTVTDQKSIFEQIKDKYDILKFCKEFLKLPLRASGKGTHQCDCPLHGDKKTPSFTVYEVNQSFYCFGCNAGGDIIDLVAKYYNYEHFQAVQFLAEKAGIEVLHKDLSKLQARKRKRQNMETRRDQCYNDLLRNTDAQEYLRRRGITPDLIQTFNLGYTAEEHAIVIPLYDTFGNLVGFTRRRMAPKEDEQKYKNSPQSEWFDKSKLLYNAYLARRYVQDHVYVCEGQFDVMSLWALGAPQAVGIGTGRLTDDQIKILSSLVKPNTKVIFVLDPETESDEHWFTRIQKNTQKVRSTIKNPLYVIDLGGKDMNDWYAAGNVLQELPQPINIDRFMVDYILINEPNPESQYLKVQDLMKASNINPLVMDDLIDYLATRWEKRADNVRQFLLTQDETVDFSAVKLPPDLSETYSDYVIDPHGKIDWGYNSLNAATKQGSRKGQVTWIVAGPGTGKTGLAVNIARKVCGQGFGVVFFSLEMEDVAVFERLATIVSGKDSEWIEEIYRTDPVRAMEITRQVNEEFKHLTVIDRGGLSLEQIETYVSNLSLHVETPIRLIIIDYFGYVRLTGRDRYDRASEGAKKIKEMAKNLDLSILVLAQVSRGFPAGKPLGLSAARDSVTGDTLITLENGLRVPIANLENQRNIHVMTKDENWNLIPATAELFWKKNVREVLRVTTRTGHTIRVTPEHPFYTAERGKIKTSELGIGDRIAIPIGWEHDTHPLISDDEATMLGLLVGCGSLTRRPHAYTKGNWRLLDICKKFAKKLGVDPKPKKGEPQTIVFSTLRNEPNPINDLVNWAGLYGKKSAERFIPDIIHASPNTTVAAFLSGLLTTDGSVTNRGYKFSTASLRLAHDVQYLLCRLGIVSILTIEKHGKGGYSGSAGKEYYTVSVRQKDALAIMHQKIGLLGDAKDKLESLLQTAPVKDRAINLMSKKMWPIIHKERKAAGMTWNDVFGKSGVDERRDIERERFKEIAEKIGSLKLKTIANAPVIFDQIVSIKPDGTEAVYDATVPRHANFIAGGIVVSNSGVIEESADYLIGAYRPELNPENSPEVQAQVSGQLILQFLKSRAGRYGEATLHYNIETQTIEERAAEDLKITIGGIPLNQYGESEQKDGNNEPDR